MTDAVSASLNEQLTYFDDQYGLSFAASDARGDCWTNLLRLPFVTKEESVSGTMATSTLVGEDGATWKIPSGGGYLINDLTLTVSGTDGSTGRATLEGKAQIGQSIVKVQIPLSGDPEFIHDVSGATVGDLLSFFGRLSSPPATDVLSLPCAVARTVAAPIGPGQTVKINFGRTPSFSATINLDAADPVTRGVLLRITFSYSPGRLQGKVRFRYKKGFYEPPYRSGQAYGQFICPDDEDPARRRRNPDGAGLKEAVRILVTAAVAAGEVIWAGVFTYAGAFFDTANVATLGTVARTVVDVAREAGLATSSDLDIGSLASAAEESFPEQLGKPQPLMEIIKVSGIEGSTDVAKVVQAVRQAIANVTLTAMADAIHVSFTTTAAAIVSVLAGAYQLTIQSAPSLVEALKTAHAAASASEAAHALKSLWKDITPEQMAGALIKWSATPAELGAAIHEIFGDLDATGFAKALRAGQLDTIAIAPVLQSIYHPSTTKFVEALVLSARQSGSNPAAADVAQACTRSTSSIFAAYHAMSDAPPGWFSPDAAEAALRLPYHRVLPRYFDLNGGSLHLGIISPWSFTAELKLLPAQGSTGLVFSAAHKVEPMERLLGVEWDGQCFVIGLSERMDPDMGQSYTAGFRSDPVPVFVDHDPHTLAIEYSSPVSQTMALYLDGYPIPISPASGVRTMGLGTPGKGSPVVGGGIHGKLFAVRIWPIKLEEAALVANAGPNPIIDPRAIGNWDFVKFGLADQSPSKARLEPISDQFKLLENPTTGMRASDS